MTLIIFGDVTARRDPLWNKGLSETQQLEAIESMLKNYQGENTFFPSIFFFFNCLFLFFVFDEKSQTFQISKH
jgi:hypothetical protein